METFDASDVPLSDVSASGPVKHLVVYRDNGTGGLPRGLRWMLDHPRLMGSRPVWLLYRLGIAKSQIIGVYDP